MVHSFLMIGQSNIAGRGKIDEVEPIINDRLKVLRNGRWYPFYVPVNCDRPFSGISLAESFADAYSKDHPDVEVGLIPCADGGTSLDDWAVGGLLFDHAVYLSKLAQRTSVIKGILWHQGESDCSDDLYPLYASKFQIIMDAIRAELGLENTPFILGGLGDYLSLSGYDNYTYINAALQMLAAVNAYTAFASAEGLTANPDNLHFNAKSCREFGLRYYEAFKEIKE